MTGKQGYIVRGYDNSCLCVVETSRNKAKSYVEGRSEVLGTEYKDLRAENLDKKLDVDVDWSSYDTGCVDMLEMLKKGLHGWVDNKTCPVCGEESVMIRNDDELGLGCIECREERYQRGGGDE